MARILVAMSGGVDSSVAAALLKEQGHDLIGATLHLWDAEGENKVGRCCAPEDREDARKTCDYLGVPHYVFDERTSFRRHVVEPFMDEYRAGRTPSPCVHCNRTVKLAMLDELATRLGCDHIATGHYARIEHFDQSVKLSRGRDEGKDQSYFLFGVPTQILSRLVLPLGDLIKNETRAHGQRLGVPNWNKGESQELCFVPDGNISGFIAKNRGAGDSKNMVAEDGTKIMTTAADGFTIGQRKGLGLPGGGSPKYVLRILNESKEVVLGSEESLYHDALIAKEVTWMQPVPNQPFKANVQIRYRHTAAPAFVVPKQDSSFEVRFDEKQRAITPGQAVVVYKENEVMGGGFIV